MENTTPDLSPKTDTTTGAATPQQKKPYLLVTNLLQLAALYPQGNALRILPLALEEAKAIMQVHDVGAYVTDTEALDILCKVTKTEIPFAKDGDIPLAPRILLGEINVTNPKSNLILPGGQTTASIVVYFYLVDPVPVPKMTGHAIGEITRADGTKEKFRSDGKPL